MNLISRIFSWLLSLATIIIGIVFSTLNSHEVVLDCYFAHYNISLGILLVLTLVIGAIAAYISTIPLVIRHHAAVASLQRVLEKSKQEIAKVKVDTGK
ncbi:MAG: LapA family protein [Legionellales bacterium]|nr:LapA family protein [Legionellales bacterium]